MKEIINNYLEKHKMQLKKKEINVILRGLKDYQHLKEIMDGLAKGEQPSSKNYLLALERHKAAWKTVLARDTRLDGQELLKALENRTARVNAWLKTRADREADGDEKIEARKCLKNLTDKNEIEFMHDALLMRVRHEATKYRTLQVFEQILKETGLWIEYEKIKRSHGD